MSINFFLRALIIEFFEYRFIAAILDRFPRLTLGTLQNKLVANNISVVPKKLHVVIEAGKKPLA
ncbi:hypothetical protein D3C77_653600 [compost metagenome]